MTLMFHEPIASNIRFFQVFSKVFGLLLQLFSIIVFAESEQATSAWSGLNSELSLDRFKTPFFAAASRRTWALVFNFWLLGRTSMRLSLSYHLLITLDVCFFNFSSVKFPLSFPANSHRNLVVSRSILDDIVTDLVAGKDFTFLATVRQLPRNRGSLIAFAYRGRKRFVYSFLTFVFEPCKTKTKSKMVLLG